MSSRRLGVAAALVAGVAALGLYVRTLAPGVLVGDMGEFQFTGAILGIPHPTGYPLYTLLGKLWSMVPLHDVAYRINLSSAVYMAGAGALTAFLAWRLLDLLRPPREPDAPAEPRFLDVGMALAALAGALLFAVAGTVWAQAVVARSYALNALLVTGCVTALLVWWARAARPAFFAALLLIGLSFAHHGTTITLLPGYALLLLLAEWRGRDQEPWRRRLLRWLGGAGMFAVGLTPYLLFAYRFVFGYTYYWGNPQTWADVLYLARGAPFGGQIFAYPLTLDSQLARVGFGLDQLGLQFGPVGVALGLAGLARLLIDRRTRPFGCGLALLWLGNFIFAVNYGIIGHIYLIPTYIFWGIFMAVAGAWPPALAARLPRPLPRLVLGTSTLLALALAGLFLAPWVAAGRYAQQDLSKDTRIRDLALQTLAQAETGAHVYVDWESICVLRYYRYIEHRRLDLDVESGDPMNWHEAIGKDLDAGIPVYVGGFAGPDPPAPVRRQFILARVGLVYQVLGRVPSAEQR